MDNAHNNKAIELSLRVFGAASRPIALSLALVQMPSIANIYFLMIYLSPLIYKVCSLSDLVQYRRLINKCTNYEKISSRYFFVIFSRVFFLVAISFPVAVFTGEYGLWLASVFFVVSDSYLMFSEILNLLSGKRLYSALILVMSRFFQVLALLLTVFLNENILFFSGCYFLMVLFLSLFRTNITDVIENKQKILKYVRDKNKVISYLRQLRKATVETFSLIFFVSTPLLLSFGDKESIFYKYYLIGFSLSSFLMILFKVLFFNDNIKKFVTEGLNRKYLIYGFCFVLILLLLLHLLLPVASFFIKTEGMSVVSFVLTGFIFTQIINQVFAFFLSARSVGLDYSVISLFVLTFIYALASIFNNHSLYLHLSVILPALGSMLLNYYFYTMRLFKNTKTPIKTL